MSARRKCLAQAAELPLPVFGEQDYPEETRLKYRFLDLRRERIHNNILLRGKVIDAMRHAHEGGGIQRIPDPDPHRLLAGRRARLSGALAHSSRQILRPAAGAAAIQAAADDGRLRPLFPDRALFPRRGPARRPPAGRILPARCRNEFCHPGRHFRDHGAGRHRHFRGIRRRQAGHEKLAAHPLCRSHAQIWLRQAGPAQPAGDAGRVRTFPRLRLQDFRAPAGIGQRTRSGRFPRRAAASAPSPTA